MFTASSRYASIGESETTLADGRRVTYKRRRFLPDPDSLRTLATVTPTPFDRLDLISARVLGNPELFWMIADASNAMDPFALTDPPGQTLRVPVPEPR